MLKGFAEYSSDVLARKVTPVARLIPEAVRVVVAFVAWGLIVNVVPLVGAATVTFPVADNVKALAVALSSIPLEVNAPPATVSPKLADNSALNAPVVDASAAVVVVPPDTVRPKVALKRPLKIPVLDDNAAVVVVPPDTVRPAAAVTKPVGYVTDRDASKRVNRLLRVVTTPPTVWSTGNTSLPLITVATGNAKGTIPDILTLAIIE